MVILFKCKEVIIVLLKRFLIFLSLVLIASCGENTSNVSAVTDSLKRRSDVNTIEGVDQPLDTAEVQRGKVLIAYADCYTCHAIEKKAKGPAFTDIARRYPANEGYINLLANKIIIGGKGAWGNVVMEPHPNIQIEDARSMAIFILSLDSVGTEQR